MMRRFSQGWFPLLGGIFSCLCVNGPAGASAITFEFAGEITSVRDDNNLLGGAVSVGDFFSGSYTFESTTPDSDFAEAIRGTYADAITGLSGSVGDVPFSLLPTAPNFIQVDNGTFSDRYRVRSGILFLNETIDLGLTLLGADNTIFDHDGLPLTPPNLALFDTAQFVIVDSSERLDFSIIGTVTSLVPEPTTWLLLVGGAIMTAKLRKRRPRNAA